MLSKKTFDDIQKALIAVGKPRLNREEKKFLFRHFATCGSCGYSITAERHTKKSGLRFRYYRCTGKGKTQRCENRSFIPEQKFVDEVKRNAQLVTIPDEWKEKFLARIETWESEVSLEKQQKINSLKSEFSSLKSKIDRLNNAFSEGSIDIDEFKELKNPLIPKKVELEQKIVVLEKSKANRLEPLRNWILDANAFNMAVISNDELEMKSFLQRVGSNRLLRAQTLTVSFKNPFDLLAETSLAIRNTSDVSEQCSRWWSQGGSNSHGAFLRKH
jgi:hypothetical protein